MIYLQPAVKPKMPMRGVIMLVLLVGNLAAPAWATNIEVGDGVTLVIRKDGNVCSWGSNYAGRLGDGSQNDSAIPLEVVGLFNITSVVAGGRHNMALDSSGVVWTWGEGALGQIGNNSTSGSLTAIKVDMANLKKAKLIAASAYESFAVDESNTIWAWGYNYSGFLGVGSTSYAQSTPFKGSLSQIAELDAHGWHTLALDTSQNVWSWGKNDNGEVGTGGTSVGVSKPVKLMQAQAAKSGREFSLVLKLDGTVWGWGKNDVGQLGNGTVTNSLQPTLVIFPSGTKIMSISAGDYHALAIDAQGQLWSWGKNDHGQLGNGATVSFSNVPVKVATDTGLTDLVEFSAGLEHSAALKKDGSVCVWGWGTLGQIGDGKKQDAFKPVCGVLNIHNNYCSAPPPPKCDKHATFNTTTGLVTIPALDIPTLDPLTGEPTGVLATFTGQLNLLKGVEDFGLVSDSFKVLQVDVQKHDPCNAEYFYADGKYSKGGTLHLPSVDVPSVIVIPPNLQVAGPVQVYDATLLNNLR